MAKREGRGYGSHSSHTIDIVVTGIKGHHMDEFKTRKNALCNEVCELSAPSSVQAIYTSAFTGLWRINSFRNALYELFRFSYALIPIPKIPIKTTPVIRQ